MKGTEIDYENVEREGGFLTKSGRNYLLGKWDPNGEGIGEYSSTQASRKENRIRAQTRHALADLVLLEKYSDTEFVKSIVERDEPVYDTMTLKNLNDGLAMFLFDIAGWNEAKKKLKRAREDSHYKPNIEEIFTKGFIESDRFDAQDRDDLGEITPDVLAYIALSLAQQVGVSRGELLRAIRWYGVPSKQLETRLNP